MWWASSIYNLVLTVSIFIRWPTPCPWAALKSCILKSIFITAFNCCHNDFINSFLVVNAIVVLLKAGKNYHSVFAMLELKKKRINFYCIYSFVTTFLYLVNFFFPCQCFWMDPLKLISFHLLLLEVHLTRTKLIWLGARGSFCLIYIL